ncbi:MAG: hypothetical protein ACE5DS_00175 [Kiloniellaceae bacterium]
MTENTNLDERKAAWTDARLAVRRYARDPSDANARTVKTAYRHVRALSRAAPVVAPADLERRREDDARK